VERLKAKVEPVLTKVIVDTGNARGRCRARMEQLEKSQGLSLHFSSSGQNLASIVFIVPNALGSIV